MQIDWMATDPAAQVPTYAHLGDAGADLCATNEVVLRPGARALVGTGVAIALPLGTVGLITPRSGLAARAGLSIVNSPGVIDSGYRGEIKVCLINLDTEKDVHVHVGDRIAQLLVMPVINAEFRVVADLEETERADGGYGSTGGATALGAPTGK